ncbi:DUF86 domain-containing protein [Caulobacter sp. DWR2-3-1b2]|uniref:HepT-like ribonuclease domain-containing protein n=1 Tax=unclassified Caulobacter TaxID=2648921 RepID=UPI003CFAE603
MGGIRLYTRGMDQPAFLADPLACDAVAMNLLAIGENASKISTAVRALAPDADWRDAINLRHRIAHGYDDLSFSVLWSIVVVELDPLAEAVARITLSDA